MKIIVLGGAGKMGVLSVEDLVINDRVSEVVLADRDMEMANAIAKHLDSPKLSVRQIDLNDHKALVDLLQDADACVNATVYYTNLKVMAACLDEARMVLENYKEDLAALKADFEEKKISTRESLEVAADDISEVKLTPTKQNIRITHFGIIWIGD